MSLGQRNDTIILYLNIESGAFIRQTRIHQYLCRYCREQQVNHAALREHTLQHVENGDIQFKKTKKVEREEKEVKSDLKEENGMDFEEHAVRDNYDCLRLP